MDDADEDNISFGEASRRSLRAVVSINVIFAFVYLVVVAVYWGFIGQNTIFLHGYPQFGNLPVPGTFVSYRYIIMWWVYMFVGVTHFLVPIFSLIAAMKPRRDVRSTWAWLYALVIGVATIGLLIFALIYQGCTCNSAFHPSNVCNSYQYCCENWDMNNDPNGGICPNTMNCSPQPPSLPWNSEYTWHLISMGALSLLALLTVPLNAFQSYYSARAGFR